MFRNRNFTGDVFNALRNELDRVVGDVADAFDVNAIGRLRAFPAINMWEDGDRLYAEAELPGLTMEQIEVMVQGNDLIIKGRRDVENAQGITYHRRERITGEFVRHVTLPYEVNADKVEATLKDGVLLVIMPKADAARTRKIAVKTA
ncbi:Spore protein SP21 [Phycisphaerae bacterium RAS1]|nr:Spore protein SP21 [Phycisphaerae bacterium RAS1]